MKDVLYGLAAIALIVFVAVQLHDRQAYRSAVHDAQQDARRQQQQGLFGPLALALYDRAGGGNATSSGISEDDARLMKKTITLAGHDCSTVKSIEARQDGQTRSLFIDCALYSGLNPSYEIAVDGREVRVLKK